MHRATKDHEALSNSYLPLRVRAIADRRSASIVSSGRFAQLSDRYSRLGWRDGLVDVVADVNRAGFVGANAASNPSGTA